MENEMIDSISPVFVSWFDTEKSILSHSDDTYGQRIVQHYEIEYIVSSRNGYILTDGIPIPAEMHTVFFRRPGMVVEGIGVYRSIYMKFDLNRNREQFEAFQMLPPVFGENDGILNMAVMNELCLSRSASDEENLVWKAKILELLAHLLKHAKSSQESVFAGGEKRHLEPVKNALSYIQQHYAEQITLQNLADVSGYSTYYFCKLFKNITQLTPMQYVVRFRMDQAEKRLILSADPVEKIMLDVGFHNYGYFWRTFKEIYGSSPQAYRRKSKKE